MDVRDTRRCMASYSNTMSVPIILHTLLVVVVVTDVAGVDAAAVVVGASVVFGVGHSVLQREPSQVMCSSSMSVAPGSSSFTESIQPCFWLLKGVTEQDRCFRTYVFPSA